MSKYINKEIEDVYNNINDSKKKFELGLKQSSTNSSSQNALNLN
jgi:3'-phosphoadenosine 5'-phosphosulfate sulfotransferase